MSQSENVKVVHTAPAETPQVDDVVIIEKKRVRSAVKNTFTRFVMPVALGAGTFVLLKKLDEPTASTSPDEPEIFDTDFTL